MTAFRQATRYHQAKWREAKGHPVGTQPIAPRPSDRARLVGSRVPLDYGRETGANFVTAAARDAARSRASTPEPRQTFDHQRLWADLLSSVALAFNLFGDLAADHHLATEAVRSWWPSARGAVHDIRFAHSPGRWDPSFTANLRVFDVALFLDGGGVIAIDVSYHERAKAEIPRPENLARYLEVAERSGGFRAGALDELAGRSELAVLWLEHLLLHSMLQHPSGAWTWGMLVAVHPAENTDMVGLSDRYRELLTDQSTFTATTIESLLDAGALPAAVEAALRERYLLSDNSRGGGARPHP